MNQIHSGPEAAAAALVGSLATFSLVDILDLLARTNHTGELQVVGRGVDQRVWMDQGDLVTTGPRSADTVLFDLACIEEGWFYFTTAGSAPEGGSRSPVRAVLEGVGPQVAEWRVLVAQLPFDAVVKMSSSTPAAEVQIRGDQWQLLSLVGGGGRTIRQVVDGSDLHSLDTLRTLGELLAAHLIVIDDSAHPDRALASAPLRATATPPPTVTVSPPAAPASAPEDAPAPEPEPEPPVPAPSGGAGETLPPFVPPSPGVSVVPPAPEGWVAADGPGVKNGAESGSGNGTGASPSTVMPPPITGDPWSSALSPEPGDEKT